MQGAGSKAQGAEPQMDTDGHRFQRGHTRRNDRRRRIHHAHITANYSFRDKVVPIDNIESATGINFMPLLAEPTPLEQTVDPRWLNN